MKHLLLKIIIVAGIVVAVPAGLFYGLLYENNDTSYFAKDESFDNDHFVTAKMVHAFDDTKSKEKISFSITEDDLNQILYRACETAFPNNMHKQLKGMQIQIKDDQYVFNVDLTPISIFSTRLQLVAKLEETEDEFVFHLTDVKIGKLGNIKSIALSTTTTTSSYFVNDEFVMNTFASCGLTIECSLSDSILTYKKADLANDMKSILGDDSSSASLYTGIISDLVSSDILDVDFYSSKSLSFDLDLNPLHTNETYVTEDKNLTDFTIEKYRNNLKTLLDEGSIDNTNQHDTYAFSYLINGYNALSDEEKAYIDSIDMSCIGIKDTKNYQGYYHPTSTMTVEKTIKNNLTGLLNSGIAIDEDVVNDYIKTTALIGTGYALTYKGPSDTEYDVNYIALDNAYVNFLNDKMYMTLGLNMNGYETSLILDTSKKAETQYGLVLSTDKVYYGTHEINEDLKAQIFLLLDDAFVDSRWLEFDGSNGEFTIDFSYFLSDYLGSLKNKTSINVSLNGENLNSDGYMLIKGSLS